MTSDQVKQLISAGAFPQNSANTDLIETHISWILLSGDFAYKIKKPVHYSFLDFSTLEKRKFYCDREIELNKRLTEGIYLDVQAVIQQGDRISIGENSGTILDYAVRMTRMDSQKQMNVLLLANQITVTDLQKLARKIASFHQRTTVIEKKDPKEIQVKFKDLEKENEYLFRVGHADYCAIIDRAISSSDAFEEKFRPYFQERLASGFVRDGHGDLHCRNVFFLPEPQPFDCIEFNDDFRQVDVLNDVAFLCMDLDYFEKEDLSNWFVNYYDNAMHGRKTWIEQQLFIYFKAYRANIRAKINSLRAQSCQGAEADKYLVETGKYLQLLNRYLGLLFLR